MECLNDKITVNLNCPNCGGELNVGKNEKIVRCSYCNTDVLINSLRNSEKSNSNIEIDNLLVLAQSAEKSQNFSEANNYYTKVLEYDGENIIAWFGKGVAVWYLSDGYIKRIKETVTCFEKIEKYKYDDEYIDKMTTFLINAVKETHAHILKFRREPKPIEFKDLPMREFIEKHNKIINTNFNGIMDALELLCRLSFGIKIIDIVIDICCDMLEPSLRYNLDKELSEKAQDLFNNKLSEIRRTEPNWNPSFFTKMRIHTVEYKFYHNIAISLIFILLMISIPISCYFDSAKNLSLKTVKTIKK